MKKKWDFFLIHGKHEQLSSMGIEVLDRKAGYWHAASCMSDKRPVMWPLWHSGIDRLLWWPCWLAMVISNLRDRCFLLDCLGQQNITCLLQNTTGPVSHTERPVRPRWYLNWPKGINDIWPESQTLLYQTHIWTIIYTSEPISNHINWYLINMNYHLHDLYIFLK